MSQPQLTMSQIRKLFARHYGSANRLANELKVNRSLISHALRGHGSERIIAAIRARAVELTSLRQEAA